MAWVATKRSQRVKKTWDLIRNEIVSRQGGFLRTFNTIPSHGLALLLKAHRPVGFEKFANSDDDDNFVGPIASFFLIKNYIRFATVISSSLISPESLSNSHHLQ